MSKFQPLLPTVNEKCYFSMISAKYIANLKFISYFNRNYYESDQV